MHFMYGKADRNAALARHLYHERYPQQSCPVRKTFELSPLSSVHSWEVYLSWFGEEMTKIYNSRCRRGDSGFCAHDSYQYTKVISNNCANIQHLNLCQCKWLTDELIQPVFQKNTHLHYVNLAGCTGLTSSCLQPLILYGKELKCLKVQNCAWINAGCLETLTYHQCNLEEADFTCCWALGDDILVAFLQKFRRLRVLCIANLLSVTNTTMFAIASYSNNLEHLNIQGCWRVNDDGVRMVGKCCLKLQSLLVKNCDFVTERSLESLRKRMFIDKIQLAEMDYAAPILGPNLQI